MVLIVQNVLFSFKTHTAVHFNHNDTGQLFTYELYMAHILYYRVLRKAQQTAELLHAVFA